MTAPRIKLIHFSDIHLTAKKLGWQRHDWFTKRLTGWANIKLLGRGRRFRYASEAMAILKKRILAAGVDGVIFTGDATKLGFPNEYKTVAKIVEPWSAQWPPAVAVPGNHDYYVPNAANSFEFETLFSTWQRGIRRFGHIYPFVTTIGHVHIIALNGASANKYHLDAGGEVGADQLQRMRELCADLPSGIRIVAVHYPLRTETGTLENKLRRLRDHEAVLDTAAECGVQLWLHGHIHRPYVRGQCNMMPFPMICAGSATQKNRWSYHEYTLTGLHLDGVRYTYDQAEKDYFESDRFSILLPGDAGE